MDAVDALMKTLDYTLIKIDSDLPVSSSFRFDFDVIRSNLNLQDNDYYKWDIEYNDHRVLVRYYYHGSGYLYGYNLVNEVLHLPDIKGEDYSTGKIKHVDYVYGVSDPSVRNNALNTDSIYDEFTVAGNAPVDNLGLLQTLRIVNAVTTTRNHTLKAGDYIIWTVTYSDSIWNLRCFIEIINLDGSVNMWWGGVNKIGNDTGGLSGSVRFDTRLNYSGMEVTGFIK
ncbi:MAG: hypothetical protein LBB89_09005 [Treponema sp.]|jgi:hypothetical protein|nr:hypothetical protein [Treponema sp.]